MASSSDILIVSHFCHNCNETIDILNADLKCVRCRSGFVEEIEETPKEVSHFCYTCEQPINILGADLKCGRCRSRFVEQIAETTKKDSTQQNIQKEEQMSSSKESVAKEECTICLSELDSTQPIVTLVCKHNFHKLCVREWFGISKTCPLCRTKVDDPLILPPLRGIPASRGFIRSRNVRDMARNLMLAQRPVTQPLMVTPSIPLRPISPPLPVSPQMSEVMTQINRDLANLRAGNWRPSHHRFGQNRRITRIREPISPLQ